MLFSLAVLSAASSTARAQPASAADGYRTVTWDDLLPKDWDPLQEFRARYNAAVVPEGSAKERAMMKELRELWDNAPTRPELDGTRMRLPGYVVPLDAQAGTVKEFLLVPYFGACIHSPPPPANQIVHVTLAQRRALRTMDAVWVSGIVKAKRADSPMGTSGYAVQGHRVEPYLPPR